MLTNNQENDFSLVELENLSSNIRLKAIKLGVSLPKLAELMNVDYTTLMRIVSIKKDYMPNLKILSIIASFFNVGIGDLLINSKLPQKVPIINIDFIKKYMEGTFNPSEDQEILISSEWVHERACAIKINIIYCGIPTLCSFILKPFSVMKINKYFLVEAQTKSYFIKITSIEDQKVCGVNLLDDSLISINSPSIIAIASQIILYKTLI